MRVENSSPFRETNYQPEVMAVLPINQQIGRVNVRFASLGMVAPVERPVRGLSRSWNRFYGQLGLESGNLGVTARVWKRLDNAKSNNDNPDITDFLGHGDVRITYRDKGLSIRRCCRRNFDTNHGAVQASVAFPLVVNLKGYVQLFSRLRPKPDRLQLCAEIAGRRHPDGLLTLLRATSRGALQIRGAGGMLIR